MPTPSAITPSEAVETSRRHQPVVKMIVESANELLCEFWATNPIYWVPRKLTWLGKEVQAAQEAADMFRNAGWKVSVVERQRQDGSPVIDLTFNHPDAPAQNGSWQNQPPAIHWL